VYLLGHGALEHICVHAAERLEKPGAYWKVSSVAVSRIPRVMFQGPWKSCQALLGWKSCQALTEAQTVSN
jgi:hypothetical protein